MKQTYDLQVRFRQAAAGDTGPIQDLLKCNGLPFEDLTRSNVELLVAVYDEKIIGCIGMEKAGSDALLRSFAIDSPFRHKGIGNELYALLLQKAVAHGLKKLHLLTTTADAYFARKGFLRRDRETAPQGIRETAEFAGLCPASSVYMALDV